MILGAYTFLQNPIEMNVIEKNRFCDSVITQSSIGYFTWGASIVGKDLILGWDYMRSDQYESLQTLYEADAPVVYDPEDGSGRTFNVEITNLTGKYFIFLSDAGTIRRANVELTLLILSEV